MQECFDAQSIDWIVAFVLFDFSVGHPSIPSTFVLQYPDTHIHITYTSRMTLRLWKLRLYPISIIMVSLVGSIFSPVRAAEEPYKQTFVVTAYYSPVPGQRAYFRGSYEDDIVFNGQGKRGADGTPVYPGMIAAPPTYAFGSVIALDNLGVGVVHDRGGRIVEWGNDLHRIDLWMGSGEEGLARALAWGVRTIQGTVYPPGHPDAPPEKLSLENFPADIAILQSLPEADPVRRLVGLKLGDTGSRVRALQEQLAAAGVLKASPTGEFGPVTQDALRQLLRYATIDVDGSTVDERAAIVVTTWSTVQDRNLPDVPVGLVRGARGNDVRQVQKLLRFLGYYRGRTHGVYDDTLYHAVVAMQRDSGVIAREDDPSAGRIGPATRRELLRRWQGMVIRAKAEQTLVRRTVADRVIADAAPSSQLAKGDRGPDVRRLQRFLVREGYLAASDVTGTFGLRTHAAVLKFQIDRGIVRRADERGAGVLGPATSAALQSTLVESAWEKVRAEGVAAV